MFHFVCDTCDFKVDIDYIARQYVLPSGRTLPMDQRHIWCSACATITVAEALPKDVGAMVTTDQEQSEIEHSTLGPPREDKREAQEQALRELATIRNAPQHCLKCGNTSIIVPASDWADLTHEPCGGTLRCSATLVGGTFGRCSPHWYSPDGALLRLGERYDLIGNGRASLELWWTDKAVPRS